MLALTLVAWPLTTLDPSTPPLRITSHTTHWRKPSTVTVATVQSSPLSRPLSTEPCKPSTNTRYCLELLGWYQSFWGIVVSVAGVSIFFSGEDIRLLPFFNAVVALDLVRGAKVLDPRLLAVDVHGFGLLYTALQEVIYHPEQNSLQHMTVPVIICQSNDTHAVNTQYCANMYKIFLLIRTFMLVRTENETYFQVTQPCEVSV